ncbi:MAG: thiol-disulfide oxidoreductase DCC family protein [Stackebrandtia sp.]
MSDQAVFLFDGDCAFCSLCAKFIGRRMRTEAQVLPWQEVDIDALGLTEEACDAAVQWAAPGEPVKAGPDAIARLLRSAGGAFGLWRVAGALLALPPARWLAWPVYRWVARNRHRMPGGTAACSLPQSQRS